MVSIAIDARYVRERPSGIGAMVHELVRGVPPKMPDVEFLLLCHPRAPRPLSTAPNVREVTVHAEANGPATLAWLSRAVDLRGVDLFHATFNLLPARLRLKTIVTIHDLMWLESPELCRSRGPWGYVETAFYRSGIKRALRDATMILTVSNATREAIARVSPDTAARTRVTPLGISGPFRPMLDDEDRAFAHGVKKSRLPGVDRFVLTVGQSARYKNHVGVVRAFAEAFADDPSTHLVVVERLGPNPGETLRTARALGVERHVHVLHCVNIDELVALYRTAMCLCHPSFVEGWGLPVAEALASGCPVVTSRCSSMPEVAGDAALYVDPHDTSSIARALRHVASDADVRARMIERGLRRARALCWNAHVDATVRAYREALGLGEAAPISSVEGPLLRVG